MKSPIGFAFFTAMPIEAANIYFRGTPVDVGISFGPITLEKLLSYQFKIIHWPGLIASDWFEGIGFPNVGSLAVATSGYIDTVLLLLLLVYLFRQLSSRGSKRPSLPEVPPEV